MADAGFTPDPWQVDLLRSRDARILMLCARQVGKALDIDTPIPTPDGWVTMGEVRPGDRVYDEAGRACVVVGCSPVEWRDVYCVRFSDGHEITADGDHLWTTLDGGACRARGRVPADWPAWTSPGPTDRPSQPPVRTITTVEMRRTLTTAHGSHNHAIPAARPLQSAEAALPVDPYVLGVSLGGGHASGDELAGVSDSTVKRGAVPCVVASPLRAAGGMAVRPILPASLRAAGVLDRTAIPPAYLRASPAQRLALLQGLMDAGGSVHRKPPSCAFTTTNRELAEGVRELAQSLGLVVRLAKLQGRVYRVRFSPCGVPVFRCPRKLRLTRRGRRARPMRYVESVEPAGRAFVKCISVSSASSLYLAGRGMIPTHNSTATSILALYTAICVERATITVVAPVEEQANELIRKVTAAYGNAGQPIGPPIGDAVSKFLLPNGSRVVALPGKESRMRSYSATLLIMDEAARIPDPVFFAALPTLAASGGRFVGLSTAFAKSGWFYDQWHDAREPYHRLSITAPQCPRISKEFLEAERRKLGDRWYEMEYHNVFGDDVASVFRGEDIRAARSADTLPLFAAGAPASDHTDSSLTPLFPSTAAD